MQRAVIVGSSSGAGLAIDFALEHPERVDELILLGPVVHGMATSTHFYERGERNNAPLSDGDLDTAAERWANDPWQIAGAHDAARPILESLLKANPQNLLYSGRFECRPSPPAIDRLGAIRVPTLILLRERDIP